MNADGKRVEMDLVCKNRGLYISVLIETKLKCKKGGIFWKLQETINSIEEKSLRHVMCSNSYKEKYGHM